MENFHKEIYVDMDENGISSLKIKTDALGPCMCYLLTFEHKKKSMAYLTHRSYYDDVAGMPLPQLVAKILSILCKDLKKPDGSRPMKPSSGVFPRISNAHLIVAGGDVDNSSTVKTAFSLFNQNRMIPPTTVDLNVSYLWHLLVNRTIVLQAVDNKKSSRR